MSKLLLRVPAWQAGACGLRSQAGAWERACHSIIRSGDESCGVVKIGLRKGKRAVCRESGGQKRMENRDKMMFGGRFCPPYTTSLKKSPDFSGKETLRSKKYKRFFKSFDGRRNDGFPDEFPPSLPRSRNDLQNRSYFLPCRNVPSLSLRVRELPYRNLSRLRVRVMRGVLRCQVSHQDLP